MYHPAVIFYTNKDVGVVFFLEKHLIKRIKKTKKYSIDLLKTEDGQVFPAIKIDELFLPLSLIDMEFLEKAKDSAIVFLARDENNPTAEIIFSINTDNSFLLECKAIEKVIKIKINQQELVKEYQNQQQP